MIKENEIEKKHNLAMNISSKAFLYKKVGDLAKYKKLSKRAGDLELYCARAISGLQPSELIMGLSAATLYFDAKEYTLSKSIATEYLEKSSKYNGIKNDIENLLKNIYSITS
jgi:hypothetical protein